MGWDYSLLMSVLGVTLLVYHFPDLTKSARIVLAIDFCLVSLTIYDLIGRDLYTVFMRWSVLTVCYVIVLGYLTRLRLRAIR